MLLGLWGVYFIRGEFATAYALAKQLMGGHRARTIQRSCASALSPWGQNSFNMGKLLLG